MLENADHWTPPDSLGYSSLRPVQLTRQGKALIFVSVAMVIGAAVLGVFLARTSRRQITERSLLRAAGVATEATITRVWIDGSKERQHWVSYRFDYGGSIYTHRVQTPRKIWTGLAEGAGIQVRFVPSRPTLSHPVGWDASVLPPWLPFLIAGSMAASALLIPLPVRRQARLLAEGRPAPGHVTAIKKADKVLVVRYEFRLLSGAIAKGRYNTSKVPAADQPLCILYDPENPRRSAPYPMSLVRLENAPRPKRG